MAFNNTERASCSASRKAGMFYLQLQKKSYFDEHGFEFFRHGLYGFVWFQWGACACSCWNKSVVPGVGSTEPRAQHKTLSCHHNGSDFRILHFPVWQQIYWRVGGNWAYSKFLIGRCVIAGKKMEGKSGYLAMGTQEGVTSVFSDCGLGDHNLHTKWSLQKEKLRQTFAPNCNAVSIETEGFTPPDFYWVKQDDFKIRKALLKRLKRLYDYPTRHNVIIILLTRNTFPFNARKTPVKFRVASSTNTYKVVNKTRSVKRRRKYTCNIGRAYIAAGEAGRVGGEVGKLDVWGHREADIYWLNVVWLWLID